jgi:hypothetical protein
MLKTHPRIGKAFKASQQPNIRQKEMIYLLPLLNRTITILAVIKNVAHLTFDRHWYIAELHSTIFIAIKRLVATGRNWHADGLHVAKLFTVKRTVMTVS